MPKVDEPDELKLKRYEALYRFAQESFRLERERFSAAESKVQRFASLLVLILGLGSVVGVREVASVLKDPSEAAPEQWAFAIFYALFYLAVIFSLLTFIQAVSLREIRVLPTDRSIEDHFREHCYVDILSSLSHRLLEAADHNRRCVEEKYRVASKGFKALQIALVAAILSTVSYLLILVR